MSLTSYIDRSIRLFCLDIRPLSSLAFSLGTTLQLEPTTSEDPLVPPYLIGDLETDVALACVSLVRVRSRWPRKGFPAEYGKT